MRWKKILISRAKVCVTAQHREMLDRVLTLFFYCCLITDLNIMQPGRGLTEITCGILEGLKADHGRF